VFFESCGQRPNAGGQRDDRDRLQHIDGMLLGDHLSHLGLQMTGRCLE